MPALMATHNVRDITALNADIFVMEEGKVVQQGTPELLAASPATDFVAEVFGSPLASHAGNRPRPGP